MLAHLRVGNDLFNGVFAFGFFGAARNGNRDLIDVVGIGSETEDHVRHLQRKVGGLRQLASARALLLAVRIEQVVSNEGTRLVRAVVHLVLLLHPTFLKTLAIGTTARCD